MRLELLSYQPTSDEWQTLFLLIPAFAVAKLIVLGTSNGHTRLGTWPGILYHRLRYLFARKYKRKFTASLWYFVSHTVFFLFELAVLALEYRQNTWLRRLYQSRDIRWLFLPADVNSPIAPLWPTRCLLILGAAYWIGITMIHSFEPDTMDFHQVWLHHGIAGLAFLYPLLWLGGWRVCLISIVMHELPEPWIFALKTLLYLRKDFVVVKWMMTMAVTAAFTGLRLVFFPLLVLKVCQCEESYSSGRAHFYFFIGVSSLMILMTARWACLIYGILFRKIVYGKALEDPRDCFSEDEDTGKAD